VADLQHAVVLPGQAHEVGGLPDVVGHRFLDEQVFALLKQRLSQVVMRDRGRDNAQGVRSRGGGLD